MARKRRLTMTEQILEMFRSENRESHKPREALSAREFARLRANVLVLTQQELADLFDCSLEAVKKWERGINPISGLAQLSLEYLLWLKKYEHRLKDLREQEQKEEGRRAEDKESWKAIRAKRIEATRILPEQKDGQE